VSFLWPSEFKASILVVSVALLSVACAKPTYLDAPSSRAGLSAKAGHDCAAKFNTSNVCVSLTWEKQPTETDFGSFVFTLSDGGTGLLTDIAPTANAPLKIVLWMPSMGHGSSPVTVEKIAPGIFRASQVFFNMKADWEIRFQIGSDQAIYALQI
jgi:hypothetical protein